MSTKHLLSEEKQQELAYDRAKRIPIDSLVAKYGVSRESIYRYIKKPEMVALIEHYTLEMIADVLTTKFNSGSTADRELFLKYIRRWNPKVDVSVTGDININADAVARIVQEKLNGEAKK